ncbi:MAG TPA: hypothetical protein VLD19_06835 [Chitinophagaceae bacterium]|nr:hypothetical protein [Chitinophagaceae bacterium]
MAPTVLFSFYNSAPQGDGMCNPSPDVFVALLMDVINTKGKTVLKITLTGWWCCLGATSSSADVGVGRHAIIRKG